MPLLNRNKTFESGLGKKVSENRILISTEEKESVLSHWYLKTVTSYSSISTFSSSETIIQRNILILFFNPHNHTKGSCPILIYMDLQSQENCFVFMFHG